MEFIRKGSLSLQVHSHRAIHLTCTSLIFCRSVGFGCACRRSGCVWVFKMKANKAERGGKGAKSASALNRPGHLNISNNCFWIRPIDRACLWGLNDSVNWMPNEDEFFVSYAFHGQRMKNCSILKGSRNLHGNSFKVRHFFGELDGIVDRYSVNRHVLMVLAKCGHPQSI